MDSVPPDVAPLRAKMSALERHSLMIPENCLLCSSSRNIKEF